MPFVKFILHTSAPSVHVNVCATVGGEAAVGHAEGWQVCSQQVWFSESCILWLLIGHMSYWV